jgi:hypothetical protein
VQVPVIFWVKVYDETGAPISAGAINLDFGDGLSISGAGSDAAAAQHAYAIPGPFLVTASGTDYRGIQCTPASLLVDIELPIPPPVAEANGPYEEKACKPVTLSAADSTGTIIAYEWDFGDGSPLGSGESIIHNYAGPMTYTATLTVTDSIGRQATDTATVTILAPPPTKCFSAPCCP